VGPEMMWGRNLHPIKLPYYTPSPTPTPTPTPTPKL